MRVHRVHPVSNLVAAAVASVFSTGCGSSGKTAAAADASMPLSEAGGDATATGEAAMGEASDGAGPGSDSARFDAPSCTKGHGAVLSAIHGPTDAGPDALVLWTVTFAVDPACCEPQLRIFDSYAVSGGPGPDLDGGACDYYVENPCASPDGSGDCPPEWCAAAAPPLTQPGCGRCGVVTITGDEAGVTGECLGVCGSACFAGRPPRRFVPKVGRAWSELGAELAQMAQLEAASVVAFDALHADLARLGASRALLRAVRRARRDEVRHARIAGNAAVRAGAVVPPVAVPPVAQRDLLTLAIDNAEEGCVRETFGAALAVVQAERATDPELRRMMREIARDELRHAALSWDIARWLDRRLDPGGRAKVRQARKLSVSSLAAELRVPRAANSALGAPSSAKQRELLSAMRGSLEDGIRAAMASA